MSIVSTGSFLLIIIIIFFSTGGSNAKVEKLDFFVETKTLQDFTNEIEINKPGKIIGSQEIILSAQAVGNIKNILYKEGDNIGENTKIIEISDTIANYNLMVQRAKNALNAARLQYGQSKTQFDQMIEGNKLSLEGANQTLHTTQSMGEQNIKSAENSLQTADNQKNGIILQIESEKTKIESLLDNVLHQNDTILGVTNKYRTMNDSYEIYLSAKNSSYKIKGEKQLLLLYKQKDVLKSIEIGKDTKNDDIKNYIEKIDKTYKDIKEFLITIQNILTNSISSTSFTQAQIDGLIATTNGLQTAMQSNFGFFTNLKQTVNSSFIQQDGETKIIGSESTQIGYQNTLISTEKQIFDAGLGIKSAELNYNTAIKNQSNTLGLASTNIKSAELAYQDALNQLDKLNIKAPISGTIGKILVDKGQEISMGTPIISIINNAEPIAKVGITANEYSQINSGSKVLVEYMGNNISGTIISVSSQALGNGLYNATIKLNKKVENIGDIANIKIYNTSKNLTLPINIVHPLENNSAYIYILENNKPNILNIKIGEVRGDRIEILSEIPNNTIIITSDIGNYNQNIHNLIKK